MWSEAGAAGVAGVLLCVSCVSCILCALARVLPPPLPVGPPMPLRWYLDERGQTGDLVFFRSSVDWLHRLVSPLTHVAMLVVHPVSGEPHLVETHDARTVEGEDPGVHRYPARERLAAFRGDLWVLRVSRPPDALAVLRVTEALADVPYVHDMRAHVARCKLVPWYSGTPVCGGMICSEFVLYVLVALGLARRRPGGWRCVTPSDLRRVALECGAYSGWYALTK